MQIEESSFQSDLRILFVEKFMCSVNGFDGNLVAEVSEQIKELLEADCVAIYLYDSFNNNFKLASDLENHQTNITQNILVNIETQVIYTSANKFTILDGSEVVKRTSKISTYLLPLHDGDNLIGYVFVAIDNEKIAGQLYEKFEGIAMETYKLLNGVGEYSNTMDKANKYELLYRVTTKFHSSINTNDVLSEVIHTLSNVYPRFKYSLYLSQDYKNEPESDLPIKELIYNEEFVNKSSVQAFLTGEVKVETDVFGVKSRLFAPLKGKQGVYGVLQISAPMAHLFPESDVEFITLLANTAGNALENAHLYQQSKQLIADLKLINETSHKLNSNLRLSETTTFMNKQIRESFGADEIGFLLFKEDSHDLLEGSTNYFLGDEAGILLQTIIPILKNHQDSLFIGSFPKKYPNVNIPYQSVMAIPMIQSQQVKGALIVLHSLPYFYSFETFKLIQSLVHHSTLAFVNSMLREQLEQLVITDYLTKLYSRKYLDEKLNEHLEVDSQGAFLLIDIDDFKRINDTFGHDAGDELLIQVANIIVSKLGKNDFAARWGGEELAVYLPEVSLNEGMDLALQLVNQVEEKTKPKITISIGVSYWNSNQPNEKHQIFERADEALYKAKNQGKNCVVREKTKPL
ncbi:sensor domain-containing diguanylate cyclase [Aquibacillus saliphilus]|uniref:sensor domain-containing diguanylate cyclase n=1 Tax=Aquibacillus saliphilus TaxID=1909422 RepID=UPI001CEFF3BE|nr:diguanylate cyclase [Aquibacillus saliphilus]